MGWNLPPGCDTHHLPGNRPEDLANEQILDNIEHALKPLAFNGEPEQYNKTVQNLFELINNAHESGYAQCQSDVSEAAHYAALEKVDDQRLADDSELTRQQENEKRLDDDAKSEERVLDGEDAEAWQRLSDREGVE